MAVARSVEPVLRSARALLLNPSNPGVELVLAPKIAFLPILGWILTIGLGGVIGITLWGWWQSVSAVAGAIQQMAPLIAIAVMFLTMFMLIQPIISLLGLFGTKEGR